MNRILRMISQATALTVMLLVVCASAAFAQTRTLSGVIKDEAGSALPGASIVEKGTSNGTVSDVNGEFSLSVSQGATLVISYIGYVTQELVVGDRTRIDLALAPDVTALEEVVVIGYGTVKKSDLTGSVVSIGGDDLKKVPVSTVAESLTGRLAGVNVTSTEGSPDAEINIRVRGGGSLTQDNSPLYIVDGFPVAGINDISPSDIKTIDVLKDASSTAIYGSRGANGVVIITTKGGTKDKLSLNYNTFIGFKKIAKTLNVLSPEDYVKWQYEYAVLDNGIDELESYEKYFGTYQDMDLYQGLKGNNWQDQVYGRTGTVASHDLSVRGGSEKFNYSVNYARYDEKAIMVLSDYLRDNVTMKLNNKPNDKIDLSFSLRYSHTEINGGGANEQNEVSSADSRLKHSVTYAPIPLQGLTTSDTDDQIASYLVNPLVSAADNNRYQERKNYNMAGSFSWKIIDNLQWRTDFGLDTYDYEDNRFYGLTTYFVSNRPSVENQNHPAAILSNKAEVRFRNTNIVTYNFKEFLPSEHHAMLMVGQEMLKSTSTTLESEIHGYPTLFTASQAFKLTTQGFAQQVDKSYSPDEKLLSFFGRISYDYRDRYLFYATYRADGSSKFLGSNRWGYFPSAAVAWKVSEEDFMSGTSNWLDNLKLRVSFGTAGNNRIPVGQTVQSFVSSTTTWINGVNSYWSASKTLANPNLKWETTHTRNVGIDFGLLKGRVNGTLEAYLNNTTGLLIAFPVPGTGYDQQYRNIGETENKGIEVSLKYIAIDNKDYGLNLSANIAFNRNNIVSLGELEGYGYNTGWASTEIGVDYIIQTGSPLGVITGYVSDGRYEVGDFESYDDVNDTWILNAGEVDGTTVTGQVRPGMMKLKDFDDDGKPDQRVIGNANPKHTGGFVLNGYAYGFDLTAAFSWSYGNDIYNANKIEYTSMTPRYQYRNLIDIMADGKRWTNIDPATGQLVNDPTALAALNTNTTMWSPYMSRYVLSDWAVEDGSFLRLNTLTVGYTIPENLLTKLHLQNLRFYATGYNVLVLTGYSGFDPEVSTRRKTPLSPGVDYSAYPRSRQVVFGLNLTF